MNKSPRSADPVLRRGGPKSDTIHSPFEYPTRFSQDEETTSRLHLQINERFTSELRKRLFLILSAHLRHGLHRQTLMSEYARCYKDPIDSDMINTLNVLIQQRSKSMSGEPHPFQLEVYKGWFRIVPPEYNPRALIEIDKKNAIRAIGVRVRSKLDASMKHSWKEKLTI